MKKFYITTLVLVSLPFSSFATCLQTGSSAIGDTGVSLASGSIGDLDDNNTSTVVRVLGSASVNFWFTKDLGSSKEITQVDIKQSCETGGTSCTGGGGDSGFSVRYSDSPLTSGNTGTTCDSSFSMSGTATDYPFICTATARYWGLYRNGNFEDASIIASDFNLTGTTCDGGGEEGGGDDGGSATSTATTTTQILYCDWIFVNSIIIFLLSISVFATLFAVYNFKKK